MNNSPNDTDQNEDNNSKPTRSVPRVKIRVGDRMAAVEKERCGYQSDRNRHQHPRIYTIRISARHRSNENKMSDGGRNRASLGVGVWKSSQKWSVQRSAVRSIA